jgi:hypothetical protein
VSDRIGNTKEKKQAAVSKAVLAVIEKDGVFGVTHSKVSRKSGVSRAWIYEYIGKEKSALVEFAAEVIAAHFARIKMELPKNKEQLFVQLKDGVEFLLENASSDPLIIKLYFRFRGSQNSIGNVIQKYEKQWLAGATKSAEGILGLSKEQATLLAEVVLTLRLGFAFRVATSTKPQDSRENAEKIFSYMHGLFSSSIE